MIQTVSEAMQRVIKLEEGFRSRAYQDTGGVLTIGWGHTGPHVYSGQTMTTDQAEAVFQSDLQIVAVGIHRATLAVTLTQYEFDAVSGFAFNEGLGQFVGSTLHDKLTLGDMAGVALEFPKWVYGKDRDGAKVVLPDLVARRAKEAAIFTGRLVYPYGV